MKKEFFVSLMERILDFGESRQRLQFIIREITDSHPTVTMGDELITFLIDYVNEEMGIEDTELLLGWVLEKENTIGFNNNKELKAETLEELYDFLKDGSL